MAHAAILWLGYSNNITTSVTGIMAHRSSVCQFIQPTVHFADRLRDIRLIDGIVFLHDFSIYQAYGGDQELAIHLWSTDDGILHSVIGCACISDFAWSQSNGFQDGIPFVAVILSKRSVVQQVFLSMVVKIDTDEFHL